MRKILFGLLLFVALVSGVVEIYLQYEFSTAARCLSEDSCYKLAWINAIGALILWAVIVRIHAGKPMPLTPQESIGDNLNALSTLRLKWWLVLPWVAFGVYAFVNLIIAINRQPGPDKINMIIAFEDAVVLSAVSLFISMGYLCSSLKYPE